MLGNLMKQINLTPKAGQIKTKEPKTNSHDLKLLVENSLKSSSITQDFQHPILSMELQLSRRDPQKDLLMVGEVVDLWKVLLRSLEKNLLLEGLEVS
jgi:hypothetical protein